MGQRRRAPTTPLGGGPHAAARCFPPPAVTLTRGVRGRIMAVAEDAGESAEPTAWAAKAEAEKEEAKEATEVRTSKYSSLHTGRTKGAITSWTRTFFM